MATEKGLGLKDDRKYRVHLTSDRWGKGICQSTLTTNWTEDASQVTCKNCLKKLDKWIGQITR